MTAVHWLCQLVPKSSEVLDRAEGEMCFCTARDVGFEPQGLGSGSQKTRICSRDIIVNPKDSLAHDRGVRGAEKDGHDATN